MSAKQTRRAVTLSNAVYDLIAAHAAETGQSKSATLTKIVERGLEMKWAEPKADGETPRWRARRRKVTEVPAPEPTARPVRQAPVVPVRSSYEVAAGPLVTAAD